jgi:hypothetical protein
MIAPDELQSIELIKQLKARYFRCVDTQSWDELREVFTDHVEIDLRAIGGGVLQGADAFIAFLQEMLVGAKTIHLGHTPEITITSTTTASGVWMLHDVLLIGGTRMASYGHLHDGYTKEADGWRIARSIVTQLHSETAAIS